MNSIPNFLCHYYEQADGPFRNLSDLPLEEAQAVLERIRTQGDRFASQRRDDYLTVRFDLEDQVRRLFIAKGGPERCIEAQVWDDEPLQEYRNLARIHSHRKVSATES